MSKNIPCEEIQNLKRDNFWLCRDRVKVKNLMKEKLDSIFELNKSMQQMEYRNIKEFTKQRKSTILQEKKKLKRSKITLIFTKKSYQKVWLFLCKKSTILFHYYG